MESKHDQRSRPNETRHDLNSFQFFQSVRVSDPRFPHLTAPGCGMGPAIAHDAQSKILSVDGVDEADVQLVWDPPWNQNMISEAGRMKLGMI